jgi:hypothetical protein
VYESIGNPYRKITDDPFALNPAKPRAHLRAGTIQGRQKASLSPNELPGDLNSTQNLGSLSFHDWRFSAVAHS